MKLSTLAMAGALALSCAGASLAQPAPARSASNMAAPDMADRGGPMRMQRPDPAQMAERRAEHLRTTLQLRPEQEPALRAFVDGQRRPDGQRGWGRGERQARGETTTPQRLDRMRRRMAERQVQFDRRAQATLRFYAQLSPSQQKAFDALRPGGGGGRGKHGGGRDGMRHGRG